MCECVHFGRVKCKLYVVPDVRNKNWNEIGCWLQLILDELVDEIDVVLMPWRNAWKHAYWMVWLNNKPFCGLIDAVVNGIREEEGNQL